MNAEERVRAGLALLDDARGRLLGLQAEGVTPRRYASTAKSVREQLGAAAVVLRAPRGEVSACPSLPSVPGPSLEEK